MKESRSLCQGGGGKEGNRPCPLGPGNQEEPFHNLCHILTIFEGGGGDGGEGPRVGTGLLPQSGKKKSRFTRHCPQKTG